AQVCREALRSRLETRLQLMPAIAEAKRRSGQPIEAPGQEARVLAAAREDAQRLGLPPDEIAALFREMIEAGKAVQMQMLIGKASIAAPIVSLEAARRGLSDESSQLLVELTRC